MLLIRNLKRHKVITLRMTPEEFDYFQRQMAMAKQKTQTDFFLAVLRKKPIIVIEDLRPMLQELKRQGNNLNQISRQLHETAEFGEGAKKVMNECWKSYRTISQLEKVILDAITHNSANREDDADALIQGSGGQSQTQESD